MKLIGLVPLAVAATCLFAGCSLDADPPAAAAWVCNWDPTINDNWHDDYLCTNGTSSDRPDLIPDDPFVERAEIDDAAAAYEAQLNS
jgi:hypothetical protein